MHGLYISTPTYMTSKTHCKALLSMLPQQQTLILICSIETVHREEKHTSAAIAMSQNSSIEELEKSTALTTVGFPIVNVPVLSKTTVFTYRVKLRIF